MAPCGLVGSSKLWKEHFEPAYKEHALISIIIIIIIIITAIISFWKRLSKTVSRFGGEDIFVLS